MIKTKYWLSVLAISVVLLTGSLAISPIAVADDDDDDDDDDDSDNSQTYYVAELTVPAGQDLFSETVLCDEGDIATGGGVKVTHPGLGRYLENQFPHTENDVPIGWTMEFWDIDSKTGDTATVYVVCVDNP